MMQANRLLVPFAPLAAAVALALAPSGDNLAFHVEAKAKLAKTFETHLELESSDFTITLGGEPVSGFGKPSITVDDRETIKVIDEYEAVADGRATKFVRTFDDLAGSETQSISPPEGASGESRTEKTEKSSPLDGQGVRFTWDPKEEGYKAAWTEGSKGEAKLLEKLRADMDLLEFLPNKSVASGDTWELGAKAFESLLSPGGRLELKKEGSEKDDNDEMHQQIVDNLEGKGKATYKGLRDDDQLAVIEIQAEFRSHATMSEDGGGEGEMTIEFKLEGEILWDVKAGHFSSFEIKGDTGLTQAMHGSVDGAGGKQDVEQKIVFKGTMSFSGKVEA